MIKKFLKKFAVTLILSTCLVGTAFAANPTPADPAPELFTPVTAPAGSKITLVKNLPSQTWQAILASVIKMILQVTGSIAFLSFTVGGIMFLTAQGQEDKITKAKKVLLWSIVALAIIAGSFAIITGITQLKFFQ